MNIFNVKNKYHFYLLKFKKNLFKKFYIWNSKKKIYLKMEPKNSHSNEDSNYINEN